MSARETVHLEICVVCKGTGVVEVEKLVDYHKREYDYINVLCSLCEGSGRLEVTVITEKKPYRPSSITK